MERVQAVVDGLLDRKPEGHQWLGQLWEMAGATRPEAIARPTDIGTLQLAETPRDRAARVGKVFDRSLAPPQAFLRWLLANPDRMQVRDPMNFGAKSDSSRDWRSKLFSGDPILIDEATQEAERQLAKRAGQRGRQKWWLFEGFSRVACCLITDRCVILVVAAAAATSPSTVWFKERSELWRDVEAAKEFAAGKQFAVIVAAESEADGAAALDAAASSLARSFPHLGEPDRDEVSRHLVGFVVFNSMPNWG